MSAFVESPRFPEDIAYGAVGGPLYSTDVIATYGGQEQRNVNWTNPKASWNVAQGVKDATQLATLIAFFRAREGRAVGFRFKDWSDYQVTAGNIGAGNASEDEFQLRKQYISGATTKNRTITKPVSGTVSIYVNGVLQTVTTHYTVNYATGLVTFVSPPGNGLAVTATFQFDVPVRFDTDKMDVSLDNFSIGSWANIPIVEIRV